MQPPAWLRKARPYAGPLSILGPLVLLVFAILGNFRLGKLNIPLPGNAFVSGLYGPGSWRVFVLSTWFAIWKTLPRNAMPGFDPDLIASTVIIMMSSADLIRLCTHIERLGECPQQLWHGFIAAAMYTHFGVGAAFVAIISTLSLWILQDHKPLQASARSLVLWIANLISTLVAMVQYERLLHHISSSLCASRSYPAISMGSPLDTAGFVWGWRVFSRVLVGEFTSHDLFRDFVVISLVFGALVAVSFAIVLHPQATWVGRVTTVARIPFLVCCFALLFVVEAVVLPSVLCWPAALISGSPWFPESGISWRDWDQLAAMIGFILSKLFELLPPVFARLGLTWEVCLFKWLRPYAPSWLRQRLPQAPDSSISEMVADGGEPDGIIHSSRLTSNVGMHMGGTPAGALHQRATSEIVQNTDTCNRSSDAPTPENGSTIAASSDPGPSTIREARSPR